MLYKKYHRNFVRQFKMGAKFKYYKYLYYFSFYIVVHEPQYSMSNHCIEFLSNHSKDKDPNLTNLILVFPGGSINDDLIKIVKNSRKKNAV